MKRYFKLIKDNDGHNFIIPEEDENKFWEWVDDLEECRTSSYDFSKSAVELSNLRITDWEEV